MMASPQFVSDAALAMIRHAADYAADMEHGGEVVVTGQSQGALGAQGLGFLLQEYLNAKGGPHHLVHVVAWGAAGAEAEIVAVIDQYRRDRSRGIWPPLERHMAFTQPDYPEMMATWHAIGGQWLALDDAAIDAHVHSVAAQMRIIGFFFEIDPFARAGEFLGTPFVFPTELILPDRCDNLVLELLFRTRIGKLGRNPGVALPQRLPPCGGAGRDRAVAAGRAGKVAVGDGRAGRCPRHRQGVAGRSLPGAAWDQREQLAGVPAGRRVDDRGQSPCRDASWPGCSRLAEDDGGEGMLAKDMPRWCLITRDAPARDAIDRLQSGGARSKSAEVGLQHQRVAWPPRRQHPKGEPGRFRGHRHGRRPRRRAGRSARPAGSSSVSAFSRRIRLKTSSTISGARPMLGSSSSSRRGCATSARPIASICCSPPDSRPAGCFSRSARRGK